MFINPEFGDIKDHVNSYRDNGIPIMPSADKIYYERTEVDLAQRVIIPDLFKANGLDPFTFPYQFYNTLLKPATADPNRMKEVLLEYNYGESEAEEIVQKVVSMKPVFAFAKEAVEKQLGIEDVQKGFEELLKEKDITEHMVALFQFNKHKISRA